MDVLLPYWLGFRLKLRLWLAIQGCHLKSVFAEFLYDVVVRDLDRVAHVITVTVNGKAFLWFLDQPPPFRLLHLVKLFGID